MPLVGTNLLHPSHCQITKPVLIYGSTDGWLLATHDSIRRGRVLTNAFARVRLVRVHGTHITTPVDRCLAMPSERARRLQTPHSSVPQ